VTKLSTIFKKIIDKEIPADIVYEDNDVIAFNDINPKAPVHILIIPKKEIKNIEELKEEDKEILYKLFSAIQNITRAIGIAKEGYRIISNCNEYGGQEVYHLHFHILGGKPLKGLLPND